MLSMWHCTHCDLRNYDRNECCQACFNKAVKRSPFQQMMYQQTILFHGYLRKNIFIHLHNDNPVPMDIINLCLRFFEINIKSMYTEISKEHTNSNNGDEKLIEIETVCDFSVRLAENDEYWLSLQLMSVLLTICQRIGADSEAMAGLHFGMAAVYREWDLPNKALKHVLIAHDADPLDADYVFNAAYCYEKLKDFNKAKENYFKAIQLKPNNATYHRLYAQLLCTEFDELDLAKTYFQKAIELEPNDCDHYLDYAQHLRDYFKNYKESENQYLKCLEIDAKYVGTNGSYGHLLCLMGEHDKARQHIEIELSLSDDAEHIFESAYCYAKLKDVHKAKENYLKAIQLKPNDATYHRCYGQLLCAELKEMDVAKTYFDKAIELEPNDCDHYHFYAQHLRDYFKDYKESEKQYLKCLAIDAKSSGTNGSYGHLLYLMGQYDAAKKHIQIELSLNGNNSFAHYYLGLVYNALGDEQKANELLHDAVRARSKASRDIGIDDLKTIKASDPDHMEYHNKFERLIKESKI